MVNNSRSRIAFTLIEMVVVIALLVVVMGVAGVITIGLMRLSSVESELANRNMEAVNLAGLFRRDVRACKSAQLTKITNFKSEGLKLTLLSGEEISYALENGDLIRISTQGKQRVLKGDLFGEVSFSLFNGDSVVELYCLEKSSPEKLKNRDFSFRAALNRGGR